MGVAQPNGFEVVVPDLIWASEYPVWYGGVRLRARTTIVRLPGDALWVHSPCPPTDEFCAALDALGEVRWIVVPNRFHHLQAPATAARYPKAQVVGPTSAVERNPKVTLALGFGEPAYTEWTKELVPVHLGGVPFLDETVFLHAPTGTLIAADLLISACARDHWSWRWASRIVGRWQKVGVPPDVQKELKPSEALQASVAAIAALPIQRILVAHADPITERPVEQLLAAWTTAVPGHSA